MPVPAPTKRAPDALIVRPERTQRTHLPSCLDDHLAVDHPARAVWAVVEALDLGVIEGPIGSNRRQGGRPASDPRVVFALWVWGISQGEGQASRIAALAETDDVYRWVRGGVPAGERKLADFRARHGAAFQGLLTQVIAVLMQEDLVDVTRIAQDGTRTRAWAGTGSFKRLPTLEQAHQVARQHIAAVLAETHDPSHRTVAEAAAERGARERLERIERAQQRVRDLAEARGVSPDGDGEKKKAPRASMTDPEATVMKMPDGGFRPAFNVQFATAADDSGVVLGVDVTLRGTDQGGLEAMRRQVEERTTRHVEEHLADGGYTQRAEIERAAAAGTAVIAPIPKKRPGAKEPPKPDPSAAIEEWRTRMESDAGKESYKDRGRVAELTNARAKTQCGLDELRVRGRNAVLTCAILVGITINIERLISLRESRFTDAATITMTK